LRLTVKTACCSHNKKSHKPLFRFHINPTGCCFIITGQLLRLIQLIPALIAAIKAIEDALLISGQGKAKLDAVVEIVTTADESLKSILPLVTSAIGTLVRLFNASGVFGRAG
jgi:hypothetical protein